MECFRAINFKTISALGFSLFLIACSKEKTEETVFPENKPEQSNKLTDCQNQQNSFVVRREDGQIEFYQDIDKEVFLERHVRPRLHEIQQVEFNKTYQIHQSASVQSSTEELKNWGQTLIGASDVWDQNIMGQGVIVAVVDTALDYTHPQLKNQLAVNSKEIPNNGIDDDGNGLVDDVYGYDFAQNVATPPKVYTHGTHVAGIIAAQHETGRIAGLAPQAKILPIGFISDSSGDLASAVKALKYAADRGAKVINASWGGSCDSVILKSTITDLADKNILVVTAAGNDGNDLDSTPEFPSAYNLPNQLNVAAIDSASPFYMIGWSNSSFSLVQLAAPGVNIYSTVPGGYQFLDGTSMAAPFVSGAAALLFSMKPNATVSMVKQALMKSVQKGPYRVSTKGRLDLRRAVEIMKTM